MSKILNVKQNGTLMQLHLGKDPVMGLVAVLKGRLLKPKIRARTKITGLRQISDTFMSNSAIKMNTKQKKRF